MKKLPQRPNVAILGATGAVGRAMLETLEHRHFPVGELHAIATHSSAGRNLVFAGSTVTVRTLDDGGFAGVDLVFIDTPDEVSRDLAPQAVNAGAVVIDKSAAWRMEADVPLVIPEINPEAVRDHKGIIASPNCTTTVVVLPLYPLHQRYGLQKAVVSSYQSVSGAGRAGIDELIGQTGKLVDQEAALLSGDVWGLIPEPTVNPAPVAFNIVPIIGSEKEGGYTGEEWKLLYESRKIMGLPDIDITGTCVRVPTLVGHGAAVHARFKMSVDVDEAIDVLSSAPGVEVVDLPTAQLSAGRDECLVGRIRRDHSDEKALWFFSTCDNLRKGAALNAVQIAELLLP